MGGILLFFEHCESKILTKNRVNSMNNNYPSKRYTYPYILSQSAVPVYAPQWYCEIMVLTRNGTCMLRNSIHANVSKWYW